jgi:hypothetical protein
MDHGEGFGAVSPLAGVVCATGAPIDAVFTTLVPQLTLAGLSVRGVVQVTQPSESARRPCIVLRDVHDGAITVISEDRGPFAVSCRLDNAGLAGVAGRLMAALDTSPDLLVLNRFGKTECEGGGFRDVISAALLRGIPVLIGVREERVSDWRAFHGGLGQELPTDAAVLATWVRRCREVSDEMRAA